MPLNTITFHGALTSKTAQNLFQFEKYPYDDAVLSKWEDEEWFQQKTTQTMSLEVLLELKVSNMKSYRPRDILRADDFEAKLLEFSCYVAVVLR